MNAEAMNGRLLDVWVYLSASPLAGLTLTLLAYQAGMWAFERCGRTPLVNPVLIAVLLLIAVLKGAGIDYKRYFEGAQFVHFLLGPATVALAVPLYNQFHQVRRSAPAMLAALLVGSLTAAGSAVALGWLFGASERTLLSLAPKSVTTPIAMGIAEQLGGLPSLTAVFVILTGIVGATLGTSVLNLIRVTDWRARGFGMGVAAHGIGTARALQVNETAGAFSGLAMGLNGLATAVLLPVLVRLFF
jgi:predicted murein hydrolase (TIGR00659 family)